MTDVDIRPSDRTRRSRRRIWFLVAGPLVIAGIVALALFQPWKIFTRNTVDEPLPIAAQAVSSATPVAQEQTPAASIPTPTAAPTQVSIPTPADLPAPPAAAPAPEQLEAAPALLASGSFVDGEHRTSGEASLLQLADGSRIVRLESFSTSDGPDVHVWLTDQPAGGGDWGRYDDGRYLELGELKGTDGNQNYPIETNSDLAGLTSVVIWCDRFNVAFGSAAISL